VKSKANFERRQRSIETRLDASWQPERAEPMLEGGNIHYQVSGRSEAIGCGGLGMLQAVVEAVGLREGIDASLHVLRRHQPYHESDHILAQVYNILTGGRCLEDLRSRRRDEGFLNALGARRLPDPTTSGDFLRRFDGDRVLDLQETINRSRSIVWRAQPRSERELARIDVDGTIAETGGECKEGIDISYDGRWGYGPLLVSLANTREVLYVVNRPANRPSHDGAVPWIERSIHWALEGGGFEKVRLRGDTDFSLTANFDRWSEGDVEFVFGMAAHPSFVRRAEQLSEEAWQVFERPENPPKRRRPAKVKKAIIEQRGYRDLKLDEEHVAELEYRPRKAEKSYRLIILRKRIKVHQGQLLLNEETRYFFWLFRKLCGCSSVKGGWVEVQATEVEVDGVAEAVTVAEASSSGLDPLDLGVEALGAGIGDAEDNGGEDAFEVTLDHAGNGLDGLKTTANRPGVPAQPRLASPAPVAVAPKLHRQGLDGPSSGRVQHARAQWLKSRPALLTEVIRVLEPKVLGALEPLVPLSEKGLVLLPAHPVHGLREVLGDVELVEGDLRLRSGDELFGRGDVGRPHVHPH